MTSFLAGLVARGAGVLPQPATQLRRQPLFPLVPWHDGGGADADPPASGVVRPAERELGTGPAVVGATAAAPVAAPASDPLPSGLPPSEGSADDQAAAPDAVPAEPPPAMRTTAHVAVRDVRRSATPAPVENEPAPSPPPLGLAPAPHSSRTERVAAPAPVRAPPKAAVPAAEPPLEHGQRTFEPVSTSSLEAPLQLLPRPELRAARRARSQPEIRPRAAPPRIEVRIGRIEVRRPEPAWPEPAPAHVPTPPPGFGELAASRHYVDRLWS
jgi:hypothetical protein